MATDHERAPRRMLIAERGTDWLRALRYVSLSHRPFTTLVQAREDAAFLRECPWEGRAPEEILLVCGNTLTADVLTARLALLRHVEAQPGATSVRIIVDAEDGEIVFRAIEGIEPPPMELAGSGSEG